MPYLSPFPFQWEVQESQHSNHNRNIGVETLQTISNTKQFLHSFFSEIFEQACLQFWSLKMSCSCLNRTVTDKNFLAHSQSYLFHVRGHIDYWSIAWTSKKLILKSVSFFVRLLSPKKGTRHFSHWWSRNFPWHLSVQVFCRYTPILRSLVTLGKAAQIRQLFVARSSMFTVVNNTSTTDPFLLTDIQCNGIQYPQLIQVNTTSVHRKRQLKMPVITKHDPLDCATRFFI